MKKLAIILLLSIISGCVSQNWVEYVTPDNSCSVKMPGIPIEDIYSNPKNPNGSMTKTYSLSTKYTAYMLSITSGPNLEKDFDKKVRVDEIIKGIHKFCIDGLEGNKLYQNEKLINDEVCIETKATYKDGGMIIILRTFRKNKSLYSLVVQGYEHRFESKNINKFMNSLIFK